MDHEQSATPSRPRSNPFGVASLVAGVLMVLAVIAGQVLFPALFLAADTGMSSRSMPLAMSVPPAVFATIATALGVVGLLMRDRARVMAIIGTTLGASHLVIGVARLLGAAFLYPLFG